MMGMVYKWKLEGIGADPQAVGERLEKIQKQRGGEILPGHVVDDAKSSRSPLHDLFEWDDREAAQQHRLNQARWIMRQITVEITGDNKEARTTRAFVHVRTNDHKAYTSVTRAMSDKDLRAQVVRRALDELNGWRQRYRNYKELAAVFAALDEVEVKV